MNANETASRHALKADMDRVDAHTLKKEEYEDLPELTEKMLARARVNKGGRPLSPNPDGRTAKQGSVKKLNPSIVSKLADRARS